MSEKRNKFEEKLDDLISRGIRLNVAIRHEYFPMNAERQLLDELGEDEAKKFIAGLPDSRGQYQHWYSEALSLVKQVLPDRFYDFTSYYKYPRARKDVTADNYMIHDYLLGLKATIGSNVIADGKSAIPRFQQQLSIVEAAKETLGSALIDLTTILQADLFDSEVESARALAKSGFLRAAGAMCGVVIEKHLSQVCDTHGIAIKKKNPTISDFNQKLKEEKIVTVPQWRFIQHLADIRNNCDHARDREPEREEVEDLISGTGKVLKTVF